MTDEVLGQQFNERQEHRADRADGCRLGRGGDTDQDRSQDRDDQHQRRQQRDDHASPEAGLGLGGHCEGRRRAGPE